MVPTAVPPAGAVGDRLLATAARLFRERGFHGTSIDDIGRALSSSGPAVYRHVESKDALLAAVARRGVDQVAVAFAAAVAPDHSPGERLAAVVRAGAAATLDHLDESVVYLRERRHLPSELRGAIRERAHHNDALFIEAVQGVRPTLGRAQVGFLLQSLSGLYLSIAHYTPRVARARLEDMLTAMGTGALLGAPDLAVDAGRARSTAGPTTDGQVPERASRREMLLTAATGLFREHGFAGVGIDEIGAAAGIAGPGVYRHFRNKEELLAAAMARAREPLAAAVTRALAAATPRQSLDQLVSSYVDIAVDNEDTIAVYLNESRALGDTRRRAVRRDQRSYLEEWVMVVTRLDPHHPAGHPPGHPPDEVRAAVHGAIGLVNGYAEGRVRPPLDVVRPVLVAMTTSALDAFMGAPPARP